MTQDHPTLGRRIVLKGMTAAGALAGVLGSASADGHGGGNGRGNGRSRLNVVGHTTLGARDGGNTYGAVSEEHDLAAVGSFLMVDPELRLVDISDPTDPELVSTVDVGPGGDVRNVAFHPSEAKVFTGNEGAVGEDVEDAGWAIVDVEDPDDPELIGHYTVDGASSGVHNIVGLDDDHVITAGHGRGIVIYDISDPENPVEVSEFQKPKADHDDGHHDGDGETIHAAHVRGDYAFLAHWNRGMYVVDLSNPENPREVASFDYSEEEADVPLRNAHHAVPHPTEDICLVGEEVGGGIPGYKHAISFDLDDGGTELLSSFQFPQHGYQPTARQGFWWTGHFSDWGVGDNEDVVFSGDYRAGVQAFDLSDPTDPVRVDQYLPNRGVGEVRSEDPARLPLIDHVPFTWNAESSLAGDSGYVYASDVTTGFYVLSYE